MTTAETDHLKFARAVSECQRSQGLNFPNACRAALPDWLQWTATGWHSATRADRCSGGDPPESAGFDSFELDRIATPEWAAAIWDELSEADREGIEESAIEKIKKDRRENV